MNQGQNGTVWMAGALFAVTSGALAHAGDDGEAKETLTAKEAEARMAYLVGEWKGSTEGKPGKSSLQRSYKMILQDNYLAGSNKSVFEKQDKNPSGETHEDWEIFSYDSKRRKLIIRQFNSEGFVNRFVLDSVSGDGRTWVFTTEASENAPPKLKARITYVFDDDDGFTEKFQLAFDGIKFSPCVETRLERAK